MAGVKQFDKREVLERAMILFWRRGYEATSIHDLIKATGISRGSLYGTFGDKRGLFLAVLDHYATTVGRELMSDLNDPDPVRGTERMLESIITRTSDPGWPRGCLNTNTSLECPNVGDEISRKIAERFGQQESAIYQALRRAQLAGRIDRDRDIRALARFFTGVAQALNVVNKIVPDPAILRDIVKVAISVIKHSSEQTRPSMLKRRRHSTETDSAQ
jgi:TetR/AcrR family transcriptional repressor of nem operon